jgi:hypothetical protein
VCVVEFDHYHLPSIVGYYVGLKLPSDLGGAGIFDIYNTAKSGFVASYQECFKHTAIHFPVINDLIHSNAQDDRRFTLAMKCFNEERTQLICLANELNMLTHSPDVEREAIKLQHSFNQILIKLSHEEFRTSIQGRRDYEANLLHTTQEESFSFLRTIPYKKHLTMNPDRFKTAFKIRFKLPLTFGANFVCKCGFNCRDETDTHPLRCPRNGSNYACHNRALQFVKSLARDAGFHAPKGDVCLRESAPGVIGLRADGIILLADEDCSKDLILDTYGCDPTLVTSLAASSNILFDNVFAANITTKNATYLPCINPNCATFLPLGFSIFGSFSKELRALFDRFTTIIFEQEQDSFCRSLSSIRKYYLNSWSIMCMSMSAACVTNARLVNSRSYSDHDVNCNYMQDAS